MTGLAEPVDVAVIGGGPAGSATAIALAQLGRSVTVFERSRYESARIGETLPPEIKRPLVALGAWECFLTDGPIESPGTAAAWGQPELYENDFIFNPHGPGWHIDRRRFDKMLATQATTSGAEVLQGARQISLTLTSSGIWHINALVDGQRVHYFARMLVNATGRGASPIQYRTGPRIVYDRLVGIVGFPSTEEHASDRRTLIEAHECGWWYSAPLPDGSQIGAFMTDGDLLPASQAARVTFWRDQLDQSVHVRVRFGHHAAATEWPFVVVGGRGFVRAALPSGSDGASPSPDFATVLELHVVAACSSRSNFIAGDNWLIVGDAAAAFDPLSSQGITWALESGLMAAAAIDRHLQGDRMALLVYASEVKSEFHHYLKLRAHYYDRERRWPHSPFWQRRHEKFEKTRKAFSCQSYLYS